MAGHDCDDCELPELTDDGTYNNYAEWELKSHYQLLVCGLWKYIDGPKSTPPDVPPLLEKGTFQGRDDSGCMQTVYVARNKDEHQEKKQIFDRWMVGNDIALARIVLALPVTPLHLVKHLEFAKQAWETLRSYYERHNAHQVQKIIHNIKTRHCTPDMDVDQWLNDKFRLYVTVCCMDTKGLLSDHDFALAIFDSMPLHDATWRLVSDFLGRRIKDYDSHQPSPIPVRSNEIIFAIREENWYRNRNNDRAEAETKTRKRHRSEPDAASTSNPTKRRSTLFNKLCTNIYCGVPDGHSFEDCVAYGGGSQGQYGPNWKGLWNIHLPAGQRTKANNVPPMGHPAYAKITTASKLSTLMF